MVAGARGTPARRRRRSPDEAEREILAAARVLLAERPSHEVTVSAVMERTTLSRKSFYVYFSDRYDLIRRLVAPLQAERDAIVEALWQEDVSMGVGARASLLALAHLYADHGAVLRALAEATSRDPEAKQAWRDFLEPVIAGHAEKIRAEVERGSISGLDPAATARALIGMNVQAFFEAAESPGTNLEDVVENLLVIWTRTLYQADTPE